MPKKNKSAEKRTKQAKGRNVRNRANLSKMKTVMKDVTSAMESKAPEVDIDLLMRKAQSVIAKTRKKGAIHKNNMARKISRLNLKVNQFKAVASVASK